MSNLDHLFGDVMGQLQDLLPDRFKIVAKYKAGKFEEIDRAKTKKEALFLMEGYRLAYQDGWTITYHNIED
tara:strand:- start:585 stop:797 length:213 start_codon:yes stop_codon:yes gene_type:complete